MKSIRFVFFIATLMLIGSTSSFAAECTKRIESYNYLVDYSGSMMMRYSGSKESKLDLAKEAILKINEAIPHMSFQGGLYTFAPYSVIIPQGSLNACALGCGLKKLDSNLEIFGRFTPMGDGVKAHEKVIAQMPSKAAVILITDGLNNMGIDPVEEIKSIYQSNCSKVCFHIVSFADTAEGKKIIDQIMGLSCCSVLVDGMQLLQDPAVLKSFVNKVFCK